MPGNPKKRQRRERFIDWASRPEAIDELCSAIGNGGNLTEWSRINDFAFSTVRQWISDDPFRAAMYCRAREDRGDHLFDGLEKLVDTPLPRVDGKVDAGAVQHLRLQVETKKWIASKLNRKYAESISVDPPSVNTYRSQEQEERSIYSFSDKELRDMIIHHSKLPPDTVLTNEMLVEIIAQSEQRFQGCVMRLGQMRESNTGPSA